MVDGVEESSSQTAPCYCTPGHRIKTYRRSTWVTATTPQNTTQKSISIVFCVSVIRHDSSLSKYRKQKQFPLEFAGNTKNGTCPGGDCFCLRYLLSDESWRITLTQKTMKMDFCVVFCDHAMIHHYNADTMGLASALMRGNREFTNVRRRRQDDGKTNCLK